MARKKKTQVVPVEVVAPAPPVVAPRAGHTYPVACTVCKTILGEVTFRTPRPDHDPSKAGLLCGHCTDNPPVEQEA